MTNFTAERSSAYNGRRVLHFKEEDLSHTKMDSQQPDSKMQVAGGINQSYVLQGRASSLSSFYDIEIYQLPSTRKKRKACRFRKNIHFRSRKHLVIFYQVTYKLY